MESGRACVTADTVHRLRGGRRRERGDVRARENHFELHSGEAIPPPTAEDDRSLVVFILRGPRAASEPPGVD